MIRIQILLILLLLPLTMRSQEDICIGKKHVFYSAVAIPGIYDGIKQLYGK